MSSVHHFEIQFIERVTMCVGCTLSNVALFERIFVYTKCFTVIDSASVLVCLLGEPERAPQLGSQWFRIVGLASINKLAMKQNQ